MTQNADIIPTVTFRPAGTGATAKANELGCARCRRGPMTSVASNIC
jgi:hypothetical protein